MFRDLLSNRLIQVGLTFTLLCVGGIFLSSCTRTVEKLVHPLEKTDTPDPDETVSAEDLATEEEAVSPYGFGPYPELPEGWPADIWPRSSADHELMIRVQIKLISQGVNVIGATMEEGRVYPTIENTLYIRWDSEWGRRYISEMGGDPDAAERLDAIIEEKGRDFTEADIPADITVLSYEEGGIDPYTFLNLPSPADANSHN